jgi:hypothetical protein
MLLERRAKWDAMNAITHLDEGVLLGQSIVFINVPAKQSVIGSTDQVWW